jgi:hypothetical protein
MNWVDIYNAILENFIFFVIGITLGYLFKIYFSLKRRIEKLEAVINEG